MDSIIKKDELKINSLYIIISSGKYFIGELRGLDYRYSIKIIKEEKDGKQIEKKVVNKPQYLVAILKGEDEFNLSKTPAISKMFEIEKSTEQYYVTNNILFKNSFINFDAYKWLVNHMIDLNPFKVDKRNISVSLSIAKSMLLKENKHIKGTKYENMLIEIMNNAASKLLDDTEKRMIDIAQFQTNQLPF